MWSTLPTGIHQILLRVDARDRRDIDEAIRRRLTIAMPDSGHDDADRIGQAIAEICRGWLECFDPPDEDAAQ